MKKIAIFVIAILYLFSSCELPDTEKQIEGLKPIYTSKTDAFNVFSESAKTMLSPGKIYIYNNYLFVNEKAKGIHVINNYNPSNPQKIAFINIPGNYDISIKGNVMYVDNFTDIVALNISDINNISVLKRIKNVIKAINFMSPENYSGYFECVDTTKGYVVGWEKVSLINPKCYTNSNDNNNFFE